jgi:glutaredoxin 3
MYHAARLGWAVVCVCDGRRSVLSVTVTVSVFQHLTHHSNSDNALCNTYYSKSYCPYCQSTKALFAKLGVEAQIYELNDMDDGPAIQYALLTLTGQRTVPNVFINQQHVGGDDNVQAAHRNGKLKQMLGL